jgi:serine/threonine protein kinase
MRELWPGILLQARYRVIRRIGGGSMGAVYEAWDERLHKSVALKQMHMPDDTTQMSQIQHAFEQEARLLARLEHPGLPDVTDYFSEENSNFLAMDFAYGQNLVTLLEQRQSPFPLETVVGWADELLKILNSLHKHNPPVIHRDIKPGNIMLTADNRLMLVDFGLAGRTYAGGYTRHYGPPEQYNHAISDDPRSDLYALGATLYTLLTAELPPDARERQSAVEQEQPDPLQAVRLLNPAVPAELSEMLKQMLSLDITRRPESAVEVHAVFQKYLANNPSFAGSTQRKFAVETEPAPLLSSAGKSLKQPETTKPADDRGMQPPPMADRPPYALARPVDEQRGRTASFNQEMPLDPPEPSGWQRWWANLMERLKPIAHVWQQHWHKFAWSIAVLIVLTVTVLFLVPAISATTTTWSTTRQTALALQNATSNSATGTAAFTATVERHYPNTSDSQQQNSCVRGALIDHRGQGATGWITVIPADAPGTVVEPIYVNGAYYTCGLGFGTWQVEFRPTKESGEAATTPLTATIQVNGAPDQIAVVNFEAQ